MAPTRKLPSFFKIVPGEEFNNKLKIPREFLHHFHGNVPHKCRLQTSDRTWLVDVEEVNNKFYFQKGWKEFVQGKGLKYGQLLVFHYAENSDFHVDIFGKNTCGELTVMPEMEEANEEDDDVPLEISDDSPVSSPPPQKKYKASSSGKERMSNKEAHRFKSEMKGKDRGSTSSTQKFVRQERHLWRAHARAEAFKLQNPSAFLVSMQPTYIKRNFVWLPSDFTMLVKPFIDNSGNVILRVSDERVRTWRVKLTYDSATNRSKLHGRSSLSEFLRDNNLQEGDLCAFKVINTGRPLFKEDIRVLIDVAVFHIREAAAACTSFPDISHNDEDDEDNEIYENDDYDEEGDDENEDEDEDEEEAEGEEETEDEEFSF